MATEGGMGYKEAQEPLRDDGNVYYFDSDNSFIGSYIC